MRLSQFNYLKLLHIVLRLILLHCFVVFIDFLVDLNAIFISFGFDSSKDFEVMDPVGGGEFVRRIAGLMRPTTVFPYMLIGFVCAYVLHTNRQLTKLRFFIFVTLMMFSSLPSNSRAPQLLTILGYFLMLKATGFISINRRGLPLVGLFLILALGIGLSNIAPLQRLATITDFKSDVGNLGRVVQWIRGLNLFTDIQNYFGHGLSTSSENMRVSNGYSSGAFHFESTLFLTFYESGIAGLVIRFTPFLFFIGVSSSNLIRLLGILLLVNFMVVPLGSVYISNFSLFFLLGVEYRLSMKELLISEN